MQQPDAQAAVPALEQQAAQWVAEARHHRESASALRPNVGAGPQEFQNALTMVRSLADRVEELYVLAIQLHGAAKRAAEGAKNEQQDAWDRSNQADRQSRSGDYTGPRERYADANLATIAQQRVYRQRQQLLGHAESTLRVLEVTHRGMESILQDLRQHLRTVQGAAFESSAER